MRNRIIDNLADTKELEELEKELGFMLDEYDVEYPSESEMMRTINAIRPHVPIKLNKRKVIFENISSIMKHSYQEVFNISSLFWVLNSLFLFLGLVAVFAMEQSPYAILMLFAPIPTITGLLEVLKSRNAGMAELEMSLKFSLQEIILSKLVVVGGFNLIINMIFTFSISNFYQEIWIWKLMLYWITPFTVITAVSLLIVNRIRNSYSITAVLVSWIGIGMLLNQTQFVNKIDNMPATIFILITVSAAGFIIFQMKQMYIRGLTYELNH
ncbi:hypothetical protein [Paenisporosarcina indica]|uniref:hypothetical protein n=1 Tax=Paenisporosarcina indica TaxID=650093 RepID=UPI0009502A7A|nr:hypothetical protein [Paenisporosarcina indica]